MKKVKYINKKRKSKLKYKKIFIFLFILVVIISCMAFGVWKLKDNFEFFQNKVIAKPTYYLLIGEDENQNADAVAVASFTDGIDGFTVISFPSNTKINNTKNDKDILLRETFSESGADGVRSAVENLLHIKIDKYAVFDYDSFLENTKFLKNFDFYVEKHMEHKDYNGNLDISFNKGYQTLSGYELLAYIRYIDNQNEIERIQHQERLAKAIIKKYKNQFKLINKIGAYHFWNPKESNISSNEASNLIIKLVNSKEESTNFVIIPGEEHISDKRKIWVTNQNELQKTIALTISK